MAASDTLTWGHVSARAERVLVLASGPSVRVLNFPGLTEASAAGVHVIAVNQAIAWTPVADTWFTLDPDERVKPHMIRRRPDVAYFAAVPDDYGTPGARVPWHREPALPGMTYLRRRCGAGPLGSRWGLANDPESIHTGNSAFGALGLAWHMRPRRIALLGVDGTRAPYAFQSGCPRGQMTHLPDLFASAMAQLQNGCVEVVNGSPRSTVTCFERMTPGEALDWLVR
jgi:hypothetical protein